MKNFKYIIYKIAPAIFITLILAMWLLVTQFGIVSEFLLPSPQKVFLAFINDFDTISKNLLTTLSEAFIGLFIAVIVAFLVSFLMDRFTFLYKSIYPVLVITQTIPTVAIAPILVLWFGYNMLPKIILITISCFFPIAISILNGFKNIDVSHINLLKTMGAGNLDIFFHIKLPFSLINFFSGFKIAISYSVVGAVIAEWLGGYSGLGVYMLRVKKSYEFDKMFAVIILVSLISVLLIYLVDLVQKVAIPWINDKSEAGKNV